MSDTDNRMLVALKYEYALGDQAIDSEMECEYAAFEQAEKELWPEELRIDPDKWIDILWGCYGAGTPRAAFAKDYAEQLAYCIDHDVRIELEADFVEYQRNTDLVVLEVDKDAVRTAATTVRVAGAKQIQQIMEDDFDASAAELWEVGADKWSPQWAGAVLLAAWQVVGVRHDIAEYMADNARLVFEESIDWEKARADLERLRQAKMMEQGRHYIPLIRCRNTRDLFLDYLPSLLTER